jgi:hypothetical protein
VNRLTQSVLPYFYYVLFSICLVAALFVLSQATIVVMFGPSLALKGADQSSVKVASEYMREEQWRVFTVGAVSITALFAGSCIFSWALYPQPIASITTIVYICSYFFLITEGKRAYLRFSPPDDVTLSKAAGGPGATASVNPLTTSEFAALNEKKVVY